MKELLDLRCPVPGPGGLPIKSRLECAARPPSCSLDGEAAFAFAREAESFGVVYPDDSIDRSAASSEVCTKSTETGDAE